MRPDNGTTVGCEVVEDSEGRVVCVGEVGETSTQGGGPVLRSPRERHRVGFPYSYSVPLIPPSNC